MKRTIESPYRHISSTEWTRMQGPFRWRDRVVNLLMWVEDLGGAVSDRANRVRRRVDVFED